MNEAPDKLSSKTADELVKLLLRKTADATTYSALNKLVAMGEPGVDALVDYFIKMHYEAHSWDYLKRALQQMGDTAFEKIANNLQYAEFDEYRAEELFELLEGFGQSMVPHFINIMNGELNEDFSGMAALSLGRIGGPQALEALLAANENCPPHLEVTKVHEGLALLSDKDADDVLFKALQGGDEEESNAALMAMIENPAAKYIDSLAMVLKKTNGYHASEDASRAEIIDALADTLEESVIPILENFKDDKDKDVRKAVRENLIELKKNLAYKNKTTGSDGEKIWVFDPEDFRHDDELEFSTIALKGNVLTGRVRNLAKSPRSYIYDDDFEYELNYFDKNGLGAGRDKAVIRLKLQSQIETKFEIKLDVPKDCFRAELRNFTTVDGHLVYKRWQPKTYEVFFILTIIGIVAKALYNYFKPD